MHVIDRLLSKKMLISAEKLKKNILKDRKRPFFK
jgi:hypothetical protein